MKEIRQIYMAQKKKDVQHHFMFLATAFIYYHAFNFLSTPFFIYFSFYFLVLTVPLTTFHILSLPFLFVNTFFSNFERSRAI